MFLKICVQFVKNNHDHSNVDLERKVQFVWKKKKNLTKLCPCIVSWGWWNFQHPKIFWFGEKDFENFDKNHWHLIWWKHIKYIIMPPKKLMPQFCLCELVRNPWTNFSSKLYNSMYFIYLWMWDNQICMYVLIIPSFCTLV